MQPYKNLSGGSGVLSYETGNEFITVQFKKGGAYLYDNNSTGNKNIEQMKNLAVQGVGLNTFINKYVKEKYALKLG